MKRTIALGTLIIFVLAMLLSGCGSQPAATATSTGQTAAAPADTGETFKLKLAHTVAEDTPIHKGAIEFKNLVEERTNGKVTIELYPNASLGDNRAVLEAMQFGTIDFTIPNVSLLSGFTPNTAVLELPYIIKNHESAKAVLEGEIRDQIFGGLEDADLKCIGTFLQGWRNLTTAKTPVHAPADLKGVKIRTMDSAIHMDFWNATSASAVPLPFSELFTGLQQGAVDAQENPYVNIWTQGYYEVQDYLIETQHIYDVTPFIMSKITYDKLPAEYQKVILEAAEEVSPKQRDAALAAEDDYKQKIIETGKCQVIELTAEERQQFMDVAQSLYGNYSEKIKPELVEAVLATQEGK